MSWKPVLATRPLEGPVSKEAPCDKVVVMVEESHVEASRQRECAANEKELGDNHSGNELVCAPEDQSEPEPPPPPVNECTPAEEANPPPEDEEQVQLGLANVITQMTAMSSDKETLTPFHSKFPPNVSVHNYLARICKYTGCSSGCLVMALLYIDRLIKRRPLVVVSRLSCHRLILTSIVLAVKFHDDTYYSNAFYAKVGGVQLKEFNSLERKFLQLIEWKLHVDAEEYKLYRGILQTATATKGAE